MKNNSQHDRQGNILRWDLQSTYKAIVFSHKLTYTLKTVEYFMILKFADYCENGFIHNLHAKYVAS